MGRFYVSIEKDIQVFEFYRALWATYEINGIRANTMTEGIEKVAEIEKSEKDKICFVAIVADGIDFIPLLGILSDATTAPILIATSNYSEDEHHKALNEGADFYARFCDEPEKNITGVLSVMNSISRREAKRKIPLRILVNEDIIILSDYHRAFINDMEVHFSNTDMRIFRCLTIHRGSTVTYTQIAKQLQDNVDDEVTLNLIYSAVKRLRKKLKEATGLDYIETIKDVGYRLKAKHNLR